MSDFSFKDLLLAGMRIRPYVRKTPVKSFEAINDFFKSQVYFKCENFQEAGAFKFRGATNAVLKLKKEDALKGVATHSSGNHAAALALAAQNIGMASYIVMPSNSSRIKIENVRKYGGEITFCEPTLEAREEMLEQVVKTTGATFIHPYDHYDIVCGQGTAAFELVEESGPFDVVMAPVGGGGLLSGTSIAVKNMSPECLVVGAEPANADDARRSFLAGEIIPQRNPDTIADGLRTSLGRINFECISRYVDDILTADEDAIREAMVLIRKETGMMVEPSSAVPVAVMLRNRSFFENRKTGIIISGGNISADTFDELVAGH
ncbi:MAG: pyridoxal-phosphate dependent enzyme [Bacteroidota bacterium]